MAEAAKDLQRFRLLLQAAQVGSVLLEKGMVWVCSELWVLGVLSCHLCLVPGALSMCGEGKIWLFPILQRLWIYLVSSAAQKGRGKCCSVLPALLPSWGVWSWEKLHPHTGISSEVPIFGVLPGWAGSAVPAA